MQVGHVLSRAASEVDVPDVVTPLKPLLHSASTPEGLGQSAIPPPSPVEPPFVKQHPLAEVYNPMLSRVHGGAAAEAPHSSHGLPAHTHTHPPKPDSRRPTPNVGSTSSVSVAMARDSLTSAARAAMYLASGPRVANSMGAAASVLLSKVKAQHKYLAVGDGAFTVVVCDV